LFRRGGFGWVGRAGCGGSRRLPKTEHAALIEHRNRHLDAAEAKPEALIFQTSGGQPLDKANLRRTLRSLCRRADIGIWTPNELRHTCASLLLAEGVSPHHVATLLGHVDTRMIYKHYAHTVTSSIDHAVGPMDGLLG